jgi:hypothetical protein
MLHNLRLAKFDAWIFWVPISLWLLTMGLLCWWAALGGRQPLGFFGPLLIMPKANLGPLLGILITGPGGFVLRALGGAVAWRNAGSN